MASRGETNRLKRIEAQLEELLGLMLEERAARGGATSPAATAARPATSQAAGASPAAAPAGQAGAQRPAQVLDTRPVQKAPPRSAAKPGAAMPAPETPLLVWLRNAEGRVPAIRELLARGQKHPALTKRAVGEAQAELLHLAHALGESNADESLVQAVEAAGNQRLSVLYELLVRAAQERI